MAVPCGSACEAGALRGCTMGTFISMSAAASRRGQPVLLRVMRETTPTVPDNIRPDLPRAVSALHVQSLQASPSLKLARWTAQRTTLLPSSH